MKKVNEVSRLAGVSKRTLQFYDDEGPVSYTHLDVYKRQVCMWQTRV